MVFVGVIEGSDKISEKDDIGSYKNIEVYQKVCTEKVQTLNKTTTEEQNHRNGEE